MKLTKQDRETLDMNLGIDIKQISTLPQTDVMHPYYKAHLEGLLDATGILNVRLSKAIREQLSKLEIW